MRWWLIWPSLLALMLISRAATAQTVIPFHTRSVHVAQLNDGCKFVKTVILADPRSNPGDWQQTASFAYLKLASLKKYGNIEIDLRRDDEDQRPRAESGLAHLGVSLEAPNCTKPDKIDYFNVASRVLTKRDFDIRSVNLALTVAEFENADDITRKLFKLPKTWRLPDVDMRKVALPATVSVETADMKLSADILLKRVVEFEARR